MQSPLDLTVRVEFPYRLHFTCKAFAPDNTDLLRTLDQNDSGATKALFLIEQGMRAATPELEQQIKEWFAHHCPGISLRGIHYLAGGEVCKGSLHVLKESLQYLADSGIDRHSYLIAIGGGAFLDVVGLAAALAHRGVRLVRMPTTTLSQGDSGVGVKNGINFAGQKNYLGSFAVPWATINDSAFLESLPPSIAREGLAEAVKVAVVKDTAFFEMIERNIAGIASLEPKIINEIVTASAILHARHIAESGDAFEQGTSRPLDFGHWSAHYLESMSGYSLSHGQAVSIGLCLDLLYSVRKGWLESGQANRIIRILQAIGLPLSHPLMGRQQKDKTFELLNGIDAFREHLGGELTILMVKRIGFGEDIHEIDRELMSSCIRETICGTLHPLLES